MLVFCASIAEYRCTGGCWIETHEVLKDLWSRMSFTADTFAWLCTVRPGTSHRSQVFCACAATTCAMAKAAHCLKGPVRCSTWTDSHKDQISRPSNSQKYTQNQKEESEWIVKHEKKAREQYGNKANKSFTFFQKKIASTCYIYLYLVVVWVLCNTTKRFVFWSLAAVFASGFSWFVTEHSFASSKAPFLCCKFLSAARQSKAWGVLWNWIVAEVLICTKIRWLSAIRESHKATQSLEISKV